VRFIPTQVHGMLDILMGVVLIAAPFLLRFDRGAATWVPVILGAGVIAYSLITDYELGIARIIPMPVHLMLDIGGGALLAASPRCWPLRPGSSAFPSTSGFPMSSSASLKSALAYSPRRPLVVVLTAAASPDPRRVNERWSRGILAASPPLPNPQCSEKSHSTRRFLTLR
jgi:hypothetical protein